MAVRELSHERRNIMLPRYWRYDGKLTDGVAFNSTAGWGGSIHPIRYNITLTEVSHVKVYHFCQWSATPAAWNRLVSYPRDVTGGVNGGFSWRFANAAATGYKTVTTEQVSVFEDVPIGLRQFGVFILTPDGINSVSGANMIVDVCRA